MIASRTDPESEAPLTAAACLFHGFSDRARLVILQHLLLGEHRVVELTEPPEATTALLAAAEQLLDLTGSPSPCARIME